MPKLIPDPRDADVDATEARAPEHGYGSIDTSKLPRGASEGPLKDLIPVYVDIETYVSDTINLDSMTLRQYFAATHLTMLGLAIGNTDPVEVFYTPQNPGPAGAVQVSPGLIQVLCHLARDPSYVFIGHNTSFDMRGLRFLLGVPHPINVWCTMEGAMAAWPELPGGFGLANIARRLQLPKDRCKLELDLQRLQRLMDKCPLAAAKADELIVSQMKKILVVRDIPWPSDDVITIDLCHIVMAIYNQRDVEAMRDVFLLQAARVSAPEQGVALRTHHQRRHHFVVDGEKLSEFVDKMDENAEYAEKEVEAMVGTGDLRAVFNRDNDNGMLTSIRYQRLKKLVNEKLANEAFESTSLKKISPLQLARNPNVFALLTQTTRAGKMMSHKRRAKIFAGVDEVDVELGYCLLEGTPVLTPNGWVPIETLSSSDQLWDGTQWVQHDGIIDNGVQECILVGGIWMTRGHKVLSDYGMEEACQLHEQNYHLRAQLGDGGRKLVLLSDSTEQTGYGWSMSDAAAVSRAAFNSRTSKEENQAAASCVETITESMTTSSQMTSSGDIGETVGAVSLTDVKTQKRVSSVITVDAESRINGRTNANSSVMSSHLMAGIASSQRTSPLTGLRTKRTTVQATSDSSQVGSTNRTGRNPSRSSLRENGSPPHSSKNATDFVPTSVRLETGSGLDRQLLKSLNGTSSPASEDVIQGRVFDVLNAGPNFRFQAGGLIVSNCRAHTGRFSSPSTGRGLNLHNVPKHDKAIAEPVRKLFKVPPGMCLVRGDLANVEYRIEGYLTGCQSVFNMFDPAKGGDIYTDPYSAGWKTMTSMSITKKDPVRQVAKSATLGLGFCMSAPGYAKVLLTVLADKKSGVTEAILRDIIIKNSWKMPDNDRVHKIESMLGCSRIVSLSAFHIHKLFNAVHPEFRSTAYWIVRLIERVASAGCDRSIAKRAIDEMYLANDAPDRNLINLEVDDDPLSFYSSVRASCGPWPRTVCWREPHLRKTDFAGSDTDKKLTIRKATGEFKIFTPQLAIENITQAAARNALCMGVARLDHMGFKDVIHVHDEVMILCKRERNAVLAARDALLTCFGPKHTMPYAWAILVKPEEITLTESLYEDENDVARFVKNAEDIEVPGPDRWGKIERNEPGCLIGLP